MPPREIGACQIVIDGIASTAYQAEPDGGGNDFGLAVKIAVTRPVGAYTAGLPRSSRWVGRRGDQRLRAERLAVAPPTDALT